METGLSGFDKIEADFDFIKKEIRRPNESRLLYLMQGLREGLSNEELFDLSAIDPWFLSKFREIFNIEKSIDSSILSDENKMREAKTNGFSDKMIASLLNEKDEVEDLDQQCPIGPLNKSHILL